MPLTLVTCQKDFNLSRDSVVSKIQALKDLELPSICFVNKELGLESDGNVTIESLDPSSYDVVNNQVKDCHDSISYNFLMEHRDKPSLGQIRDSWRPFLALKKALTACDDKVVYLDWDAPLRKFKNNVFENKVSLVKTKDLHYLDGNIFVIGQSGDFKVETDCFGGPVSSVSQFLEYLFSSFQEGVSKNVPDLAKHHFTRVCAKMPNSVSLFTEQEFRLFEADKIKAPHLVLITSFVNLSTLSVFSPEQRFAQTIETIKSVKKHLPRSKIVLLEGGKLKSLQAADFDVDEIVFYDVSGRPKSDGEVHLLHSYLSSHDVSDFSYIHKVSGRYLFKDDSPIGNLTNNKCLVKEVPSWKPQVQPCYYATRYFRWTSDFHDHFMKVLTKIKEEKLVCGHQDIEHALWQEKAFPVEKTMLLPYVGVYGYMAPNGIYVED